MKTTLPAVIEAEAAEITTGRERSVGDRQLVEMWAARSSSPNTRRNYLRQVARLLDFLEGQGSTSLRHMSGIFRNSLPASKGYRQHGRMLMLHSLP